MLDLTTLIANRLANSSISALSPAALPSTNELGSQIPLRDTTSLLSSDLPVLQLSNFPIALTPTLYANPRSNSNPNGTLTSLYAFRQLIDPVPSFTEYYSPAPTSTESIYANLINGATASPTADYTRQVLFSAQQEFNTSGFPNLDGNPGKWQPIYATPEDWYDVNQSSRFITMDLEIPSSEGGNHPYIVLTGQTPEPLSWNVGNTKAQATSVPIDAETRLQAIQFKYLEVKLTRPWLDFEIFGLKDWYLQGQRSGYISSGKVTTNAGVLPLLPLSLIIGIDTTVAATLGQTDQNLINDAVAANQFVSLGPFVLQTGMEQANSGGNLIIRSTNVVAAPQTLYVVGWFSSLVPLSPKVTSRRS